MSVGGINPLELIRSVAGGGNVAETVTNVGDQLGAPPAAMNVFQSLANGGGMDLPSLGNSVLQMANIQDPSISGALSQALGGDIKGAGLSFIGDKLGKMGGPLGGLASGAVSLLKGGKLDVGSLATDALMAAVPGANVLGAASMIPGLGKLLGPLKGALQGLLKGVLGKLPVIDKLFGGGKGPSKTEKAAQKLLKEASNGNMAAIQKADKKTLQAAVKILNKAKPKGKEEQQALAQFKQVLQQSIASKGNDTQVASKEKVKKGKG
jgi:hypothetical protein